jgi:hypothetical protein
MGMVEDIITTLQEAAGSIRYQSQSGSVTDDLSDLIQSYNEVTGLIRNVIGQYQTPTATRAFKLVIAGREDPYMWREPAIASALEEITDEDRLNIHDVILASRLPGKTKIPPRRRRRRYIDEARAESPVDYVEAGGADDEDDDEILA